MRSNARLDTHSVEPSKLPPVEGVPVVRPIGNPERFGQEIDLRVSLQENEEEEAVRVTHTDP